MPEKFLPIGSVVLLKEGTKRLMITGFCVIAKDNSNKIYDYCGCLYPEGIITSDQTALFNHEQIDKIYYIGLNDEENTEFQKTLKELLKNNTISKNPNTPNNNTQNIDDIPPIGPGL